MRTTTRSLSLPLTRRSNLYGNVVDLRPFLQGKELKNNAMAGVVLSDHSLVLQGLTRYSAGNYTCLAVNSEGKTASNPVSLRIMCKSVLTVARI